MDKRDREIWAKHFNDIADEIYELTDELLNNKDIKEFLEEMQRCKNKLENEVIDSFKKSTGLQD